MPQGYPTGSDTQNLIISTGLFTNVTVPPFSQINWNGVTSGVVSDFKSKTGREFIAAQATRTYDPPHGPRGILALGQDLCSDPSCPISVTVNGSGQALNSDYYMGPENADNEGKPWQWIEFPALTFYSQYPRRCVHVMGYWGYSAAVSDLVFQAIIQKAAATIVPQLSLEISKGLWKSKEGDTDYTFAGTGSTGPLANEKLSWEVFYDATVIDMKRVQVF